MMRAYPRHIVNLRGESFKALLDCVLAKQIINGPQIKRFEEEFSKYTGSSFAIGISQARLGLIAVLKSLGLEKGDEVILPAYNFHIIAEVIIKSGLTPVFADIDPDTYNIDPVLIKNKINQKTKAIIVTHMFGQPAEMDEILILGKENNIKVIEDCAHSLGSEYKGKKTGTMGDAGIFSFSLGKNMPCFGGGMITTNDRKIYETLKEYIDESGAPQLKSVFKNIFEFSAGYLITATFLFTFFVFPLIRLLDIFGIDIMDLKKKEVLPPENITNFDTLPLKLLNIQAAVGMEHFKKNDFLDSKRYENSLLLTNNLSGLNGIKLPSKRHKSNYLYYKVRVEDKCSFRKQLLRKGIDTSKRSEMSDCSGLSAFAEFNSDYPNSIAIKDNLIELPNNHYLDARDIEHISKSIKQVLSLKHG
ncbi:MAG: DegT/DnrJ/EryC1/StrS family aminotransferase [Candidatus Omnitrophota bacterium]